jgi:hypothetical protein
MHLWSQNCIPNTENITPLGLPVVKFYVSLPEHSINPDKPGSDKMFVPIPLLNEGQAKYRNCIDLSVAHGMLDTSLSRSGGQVN